MKRREICKLFITTNKIGRQVVVESADVFFFVILSSDDWNECNRDPNFGGRFDNSSNFRLDTFA